MSFFRRMMIAGLAGLIQRVIPCTKTHPDDVYDFLIGRPDHWVVYIGEPSILDVGRLPKMDKWLWGREPFSLPAFRVPKLNNALVTACCISKDGMTELITFSSQLEQTPRTIQPAAEAGNSGHQTRSGGVVNGPPTPVSEGPKVREIDGMGLDCLQCHAFIPQEQSKCSKCGWTWDEKAAVPDNAVPMGEKKVDLVRDIGMP